MRKGVVILGATGSIGVSTLDVVSRHPEQFSVVALIAQRNVEKLFAQCIAVRPRYAVMADVQAAHQLRKQLRAAGNTTEVLSGISAMEQVVGLPEVQYVMSAIVGAAGLQPTLAAVRASKRILLANKESLVIAGGLFMQEVRTSGAVLLPIDSEHNAIFQCLPDCGAPVNDIYTRGVRRLILTGSGGPFRTFPKESLDHVTPQQACAHPNWVMGKKISVDSATLMNKGLELIEAYWLFGLPLEKIDVVIHPQSVIHSMVEYKDGSVLAQLGTPDMRTPIAHALSWPEKRIASGAASLDFIKLGALTFEIPDTHRFPCLQWAREAISLGGTAPVIVNAANEIAVQSFLDARIRFTDIPCVIAATLEKIAARAANILEDVFEEDARARAFATAWITTHATR